MKTLLRTTVLSLLCTAVLALNGKSVDAANGLTASAPGVTSASITIGFIYSASGIASTSYINSNLGAMARLDAQNAAGGVNGRKLKLVVKDDQSSLTQMSNAADELAGSTFAIIPLSSFTFAAAPALQRQGVPVIGYEVDGPEWGQAPYTNMFSFTPPASTPFGGTYYTWTDGAKFLKSLGVTKMANLAYGISPSAVQSTKDFEAAAAAVGMKQPNCYDDVNVPFGSADFTGDALAIAHAGCNGVEAALVDNSDVALSQAVKNQGIKGATQLYYTGYSQAVLDNAGARSSYQGAYIQTNVNFTTPNPAVQKMLDAFQKYIPGFRAGQIPDYGVYNSYIAMDLMIKGLELAGKNPTRQSFINNLHTVTDYTAEGIFPDPGVNFSLKIFGTTAMLPKTACTYIVRLEGSRYVPINGGQPVCGNRLPVQ